MRQKSVTMIHFGLQNFSFSFVLLDVFSLISHCEPRIFALLERKNRRGDNSRTSTWCWLCMDINLIFFHNLATYCSSLLGLRYNFFFRYFFFFLSCADLRLHINDAKISSSCLQIHQESPEESIKKAKKIKKKENSAKKWNESKRPKNTVGKNSSRSFRVKWNFSSPCCNKDWQYINRGLCCVNLQTVSH